MSFLPYGSTNPAAWFSAAGLSGAAHGALVAAFVMGAVPLLPTRQPPNQNEQDFFVSLEILDAELIEEFTPDTEAVLPLENTEVLDEVLPDTDAEELAALTPDTLTDAEEITPADVEPEIIPEAEPDPEPVEIIEEDNPEILPDVIEENTAPEIVEDPAPVAPQPDPDTLLVDDMSPVEDSVISPLAEGGFAPLTPEITEDTTAPQPVFPDDPVAEDVVALPQPEDIVPDAVIPDDDTVAVLIPDEPTPDAEPEIVDDPALEAVQPLSDVELTDPDEPAQPETPQDDVADAEPADPLAVPGTQAGSVIENPTPQDVALGRLLQRSRTIPVPQCSVALPRRAADGAVGLSLIGADGLVLNQYATRILDRTGIDAIQARELVDARQCAVLDALSKTASFPATRIGVTLQQTELYNGQPLRGSITGAGGQFITLLLIDNTGRVQNLYRFTRIEGQTATFDFPVTRSGTAGSTLQLLVVLGTTKPIVDEQHHLGMAQDVFTAIDPEQLSTAVFGVASFDVQ